MMIDYRDARRADGPGLAMMAERSFVETFGHLYRKADLDAFVRDAFGPRGLPSQIGDPAYPIRLALEGDRIAGFCKLGPCALPSPPVPAGAAELKQLYVLRPWQGTDVAANLMNWALATTRLSGARDIALSVFAENHRAQRFYARYGFAEIGAHPFKVGEQMDDDRIWALHL
jgi:diamine N-acetyltransferase